jgi:2-dehydro-3-deoxygalactonokinase
LIGIEWGQHVFQAFRLRDGMIRDRRTSLRGLTRLQDRRFADTLREEVGPWLANGETNILIAGAVAGPDGWTQVPTLSCPAGAAEIAAALTPIGFDWGEVRALPRLSCATATGAAEYSRGEEARFAAALALLGDAGSACLPGMRSRWVRIAHRRIAGFTTHLTGELFAALRPAGPALRMAREPVVNNVQAFEAGLARAAQPGGLLHHLSAARDLADEGAPSFLFGVLVGHEVRAALAEAPADEPIHVIGAPEMTGPYARAIEAAGFLAEALDGEAVARGLALIGKEAGLG